VGVSRALSLLSRRHWPPNRRSSYVSGCETVLVVENNKTIRTSILVALRTHGYRTLEAFEGDSGWTTFLAYRHDIDTVLSDVALPQSGPEMVKRIFQSKPFLAVGFLSDSPELPFSRPQ
jgi:DNA-binding response OmpR family regulator